MHCVRVPTVPDELLADRLPLRNLLADPSQLLGEEGRLPTPQGAQSLGARLGCDLRLLVGGPSSPS
eukprot:9937738-Alexandrium_andersonii.AAC.1